MASKESKSRALSGVTMQIRVTFPKVSLMTALEATECRAKKSIHGPGLGEV